MGRNYLISFLYTSPISLQYHSLCMTAFPFHSALFERWQHISMWDNQMQGGASPPQQRHCLPLIPSPLFLNKACDMAQSETATVQREAPVWAVPKQQWTLCVYFQYLPCRYPGLGGCWFLLNLPSIFLKVICRIYGVEGGCPLHLKAWVVWGGGFFWGRKGYKHDCPHKYALNVTLFNLLLYHAIRIITNWKGSIW